MFLDRVRIFVKGGSGGDGAATFRREKYVPRGGPDGGDGGRGGSVYLVVGAGLDTLLGLEEQRHFRAEAGGRGGRRKQHGAAGEDLEMMVPPGTVVRSADGTVLGDLTVCGERLLVARGGRGGLGNTHFATATRQAPRFAQKGEPGEEQWLKLELKLIAEVGLVGVPNAGKSTLLAALSRAHPKVGDYPFTTLMPSLGVATVGEHRFVVADIPGLVAGAATGAGLGHEFLRHVERTRVLVHVVDGSLAEPVAAFDMVNRELAAFSADVGAKPQVVAVNKLDLTEAAGKYAAVRLALEERGMDVHGISALSGAGVPELLAAVARAIEQAPSPPPAPLAILRPRGRGAVSVEPEGSGYRVRGARAERMTAMTDFSSDEAVALLERQLARLGVFAALGHAGAGPGDVVRIGHAELVWGGGSAVVLH